MSNHQSIWMPLGNDYTTTNMLNLEAMKGVENWTAESLSWPITPFHLAKEDYIRINTQDWEGS